jgi:hypothetical protein
MAQESKSRLRGTVQTTGAAATPLNWELPDGTIVTELPVPVNSVLLIMLGLMAISGGTVAIWKVHAGLKRGAGALAVVGAPDVVPFKDVGAAAWIPAFVGTNGAFRVDVVGVLATVIDWRAELEYNLFQP